MQFNHPEVLYALFLLIIPVIIHFFQLRKFRKESFTNVKFLKRLTQQTRKSSRIKKWLVLASRILLLSCIIFAFARPYFPTNQTAESGIETIIYLDNSYSMEANGQRGRLLERNIQELLENLPEDKEFTLITNNNQYAQVSKTELQEINYSSNSTDFNSILLKARSRFSTDKSSAKKLLLISDFPESFNFPNSVDSEDIDIYVLPQKPEGTNNISLDTLYLIRESLSSTNVVVELSFSGEQPGSVPVSFYNGEELLGKSSVDFSEGRDHKIAFPIEDTLIIEGKIQVEDNAFQFDNSLYFTLNKLLPIKISSIDAADSKFLSRIFSSPEFKFQSMPIKDIDYNTLVESQVVIINELEDLPGSLANTFIDQARNNVVFIIIPSSKGVGPGLQNFMQTLGISGYGSKQDPERLITGISFQHPLFSDVFEEQIRNFEYPKVQVSYDLIGGGYNSVLSFEDNKTFLAEARGNFVFTAPLNIENSNFSQSPLIVPSFFNMGASALDPGQMYYLLGKPNRIDVPVELPGDRILNITSPKFNFIPQQQTFSKKVELSTDENPQAPGNYKVLNNDYLIMGISYNVNRGENDMNYLSLSEGKNVKKVESLEDFFTSAGYLTEDDNLWKWFVIFALIFLVIETLLLKYLK